MFACCCSQEARDSDSQLSFHTPADERVAQSELSHRSTSSAQLPRTLLPQTSGASSASSSSGHVEADKSDRERERDRLQRLVNRFARKAVRGVPCTYLDETTGERFATKYRVDKGQQILLIVGDKSARHAEVTCPVGGIQDIYSIVEDGEACFPQPVRAALRPEELEKLLMVVYNDTKGGDSRFCLLEDSRASLDMFMECLKVLSIYAQQPPNAV